jgi:hypothetical protein
MSDNAGVKALEAEPCRCVRCGACDGHGNIPIIEYGFEELETCYNCGGSGLDEVCDRCQMLEEMDQEP